MLLRLTRNYWHNIAVGQGAVTYQLCNENLRWATVFREMEEHRDGLGIEDYSVSQTTLEQVSLLGASYTLYIVVRKCAYSLIRVEHLCHFYGQVLHSKLFEGHTVWLAKYMFY